MKYGVRHNCERAIQRRAHFTVAGVGFLPAFDNRDSVGVARIDLIEHIIECFPIVHLGVQTP